MAKWGYVGWFPTEALLVASMPAAKCAGNMATVGTDTNITYYFCNGVIWAPGGNSLGNIYTPTGLSAGDFETVVTTVGTSTTVDAPWGVGREFILAPGIQQVPTIDLPTASSIAASATGNNVLYYSKHSTVVAETAVIKVADDLLQKRSIHGRGVFRNINIDGAKDDASHGLQVHGIWYDTPATGGDVHYMDNVTITSCTGSGIKVSARDQFAGIRVKSVVNDRYGFEFIDMNDSKLFAPGANGNILGALYLEHCATPKFYGVDFGNPSTGYAGTWTVTMVDQARAMFCGGEIQGRIGILGRNDNSTNRWEMTGNIFDGINFKVDPNLDPDYTYNAVTISAQVYAEDIDGLTFNNCKYHYDDNQPDAAALAATPDYFLHIANSAADRDGAVRFSNMSNIVHRRSRPGAALPPLVAFTKHYSNKPYLIEWDFTPGALELVPYDSTAGERPRNYVYCAATPQNYNKADYPMGYLFATLITGGTLDDVNTTFTLPAEPSTPPAGFRWGMRVWP